MPVFKRVGGNFSDKTSAFHQVEGNFSNKIMHLFSQLFLTGYGLYFLSASVPDAEWSCGSPATKGKKSASLIAGRFF